MSSAPTLFPLTSAACPFLLLTHCQLLVIEHQGLNEPLVVRGRGDECTVTVVRIRDWTLQLSLQRALFGLPWQGSVPWSSVRTHLLGNRGSQLNVPVPESQCGSPPGGVEHWEEDGEGRGLHCRLKGTSELACCPGFYLVGTPPFPIQTNHLRGRSKAAHRA